MYHLELRQFPHVARRFNQSEQQVLALVKPWAGEQWVEEAERKWNINEATLTILEGPKLSMPDLAMGRGWRNAQRRSEDVTERVLGAFRGGNQSGGRASDAGSRAGDERAADRGGAAAVIAPSGTGQLAPLADSLALELLALLDERPQAPERAWRLAQERLDARLPADALALADGAVRALLGRELIVLRAREAGAPEVGKALAHEQAEAALGSIEAWAHGEHSSVLIERKR